MPERMFDPRNAQYKKVEDLPKEQQANFADIEEGGFVRKEAKKEYDEAKKIVELANIFKRAGIDAKEILGKGKNQRILREAGQAIRDNKTAIDILQEKAEGGKFIPTDALQAEANEINDREYPEDAYIQRLRNNPDDLTGIPKSIWANKRFALEAVRLNREALDKIGWGRISLRDKDYLDVVHEALKYDGLALQYAGTRHRADKDIVLEAVKQNPNAIKYASEEIREAIKRLF